MKWIEDRTEFFRGAVHAREAVHALTLGADGDGALLALRDHTWSTSAPITGRWDRRC